MKTLMVAINAKYVHSNIAVRYITEYAKRQGLDFNFCEYTINEPQNTVLGKLYSADCDVYGFSCYIWNIEYILKLCRNLKKLAPERKIFLGGPEVSFDAESLLKNYDFLDFIVCGEGEILVAEAIKNMPQERMAIYGERLCSLDNLPFPYTDSDLKKIVQGEKLVYYETSRGCPFSCSYCLSSVDNGVRFMSLDRVKAEIKRFSDYGALTVKFVDRTFNADKKRAFEIWKYCISLNTKTCFHFEVGADLIDDESIKLLATAPQGLFQFEIGIQSTNTNVITEVCRITDIKRLSENIRRLKCETNITIHADLIAGLPFETLSSFKKSFNDTYGLLPNVLQLGFLKLLKGSPLRDDAQKYGFVYDDIAPYEVFSTYWIRFDEMLCLKCVEDVLDRYFNSGRFCCTLKAVVPCFKTPFEFYFKLSEYWKALGLIGQGVKRIKLYELLYEFLKAELSETGIKPIMSEMKKDFSTWHSNGAGTPDWYKKY